MLIPLYDQQFPAHKNPWATIFIISINIAAFLIIDNISHYQLVPISILAGEKLYTLFSSIFLHTSIWHLIINMGFLWLFGDNIEHSLGKIRFLFFYIFCGVMANLIYAIIAPNIFLPLIGASGAISAIIGAYLVLHHKNKIQTLLIFPPFIFKIISISSLWLIGLWLVLQFAFTYSIHIIGFLLGLALTIILRRQLVFKNYFSYD